MRRPVLAAALAAVLVIPSGWVAVGPAWAAATSIEIQAIDGRTGQPLGHACYSVADRTLGGPFVLPQQCDLDGDGRIVTDPVPNPTHIFEIGLNQQVPSAYLEAPMQTTTGGGVVTMVHQPQPQLIVTTRVAPTRASRQAATGATAEAQVHASGKKHKKKHERHHTTPSQPEPLATTPLAGACYRFADALRSRGTFTVCDGSAQDADGASNGMVTTGPLDPSTYHVTQTLPPPGYQLASGTQDVVAEPGKDAALTVINHRA